MAATVTPEAVEKTVFEALPQFGVDESQITRDATFEELDVDSLDLAELSQIIEDEYGVAAQGRRRRQDQDRRRRDRPGGEPRRMNREIVVTGVGAVTPLGVGARTLHERWKAGESGIADGVGAATEFDPTEYLTVKQARRADRFSQFAMVASDEALAEAGWKDELPVRRRARRHADRHRHRRHRHARGATTRSCSRRARRPSRRSRSRC